MATNKDASLKLQGEAQKAGQESLRRPRLTDFWSPHRVKATSTLGECSDKQGCAPIRIARLEDGTFAEQHGHNLLSTAPSSLVQCVPAMAGHKGIWVRPRLHVKMIERK
jgi:hypothetical protein